MLDRLRRFSSWLRYNQLVRGVLETPPLRPKPSNLLIMTMLKVPHGLRMYLVAVKSFYRFVGHGTFLVLPDARLTLRQQNLIRRHLGDAVIFVPVNEVDTGPCQRGGCWERLLTGLDYARERYVIQLDMDTVTFAEIPEVVDAVARNRSFTMGDGLPLQTMEEAAAWMEHRKPAHPIDEAQALFARHPRRSTLRYIRGSAGFAGYAKGAATRAEVELFHQEMEALMGPRWRLWGSEQVASNMIVANSPDPLVLPYPDYATIVPTIDLSRVRLGHFIGTYRFRGQRLARASRPVIEALAGRPGDRPEVTASRAP
ncbi:MAG: hypothetical protein NZ523_00905 [Elioraea sp.]|nr:hypothetical protein [Elioraea sp.]